MNFSRIAIVLGLVFAAQAAFADNVRVLTLESDAEPGTNTVDVVRDSSGNLTGLHAVTPKRTIDFTLDQLKTPQLFKEVNGHQVVFLSIESDFTPTHGGHANMRFLQSGISGSYKNFRLDVQVQGTDIVLRSDPNPDDPDSDGNEYTSTFNYIFMNANTFFGKVIGIDSVTPSMR